jgi:hypothetical protein
MAHFRVNEWYCTHLAQYWNLEVEFPRYTYDFLFGMVPTPHGLLFYAKVKAGNIREWNQRQGGADKKIEGVLT